MEKLLVSFSGGRTSAYMAIWLKENMADKYDLSFLFANTGLEHEETLRFVDRIDRHWGLGVIWLEAVVHFNQKKGCTYKVVDFKTASRSGEPFEATIRKYGIPNKAYPHCTRELKQNPMFYWRRQNAPGAKFAVGIRADEFDRMSSKAEKEGIVYPLIKMNPTTKQGVLSWWRQYPDLDLNLPEHLGNCVTCWKKSDRKLMTIALDEPERFIFCDTMEQTHATAGANDDSRVFFRAKTSTRELVGKAHLTKFERFAEQVPINEELDFSNGCSESCDVFAEG